MIADKGKEEGVHKQFGISEYEDFPFSGEKSSLKEI